MPTMTLEMLMLVSPIISPEALATTLWAASNTPITIVHAFVARVVEQVTVEDGGRVYIHFIGGYKIDGALI